jgi:hypothetical protein
MLIHHPLQLWQLVNDHTERLHAEAAARRARRAVAEWRPPRLRRPTLDLDRLPVGRRRDTDRAA